MPDALPHSEGDDTRTLGDILRVLVDFEVEFVICGGVACIMHGVSRTTVDIDIAVRLTTDNLQRLVDASRALGMQPRIPEPIESLLDPAKRQLWIDRKNATVYTLVSSRHPKQVDVFLQYPIAFDDLKKRANAMTGRSVTVLVSSKTDLIAAKRFASREQDIRDIRDLEKLVRDESETTTT